MTTELFGGNEVSRVLYYSYSSLSPVGNNFSWLITPLYLVGIWAGTGHWLAWHIGSTGQGVADTVCGRHHPLGNIPTGHRWDHIAMDILDVCDPTPDGHRYILVIADYFSKWTEAFPMKNKCMDTVADLLVDNIILRFGMPLIIHSDQGREFENGLMKSLCTLLECTKIRTAPYHK